MTFDTAPTSFGDLVLDHRGPRIGPLETLFGRATSSLRPASIECSRLLLTPLDHAGCSRSCQLSSAALLSDRCICGLFFAMLLGVSDRCFFRMPSRVNGMCSGGVSMVGGFLMMPCIVVLCRFLVMPCGVRVMF
jgi:hypothetical protein